MKKQKKSPKNLKPAPKVKPAKANHSGKIKQLAALPSKLLGHAKAKAKDIAKNVTQNITKNKSEPVVRAMASKPTHKKSSVKTPPVRPAKDIPLKGNQKKLTAAAVPGKPLPKAPVALTKPGAKPLAAVAGATKALDAKDAKNKGKTKEQVVAAAVLAKAKAAEVAVAKAVSKAAKAAALAETSNEKLCRETGCENIATTKGYCRLDYIKNWKKIKRKEMILKEGKLNQYIEELVSKYPDKYIDIIRQDLSTEVNFNKVIHDLELDESIDDLDYDGDSIDSLIGSIRKDSEGFDDGEF